MNSANDESDERSRPPSLLSILNAKDNPLSADFLILDDICGPESPNSELDPPSVGLAEDNFPSYKCIGKYILLEKTSSSAKTEVRRAVHIESQEEFVCKIFPVHHYQELLAPYWRSGYHPHISSVVEIIVGQTQVYFIFPHSFEDLHSYIREKRRLRESEVADLFEQIVSVVNHCHSRGIVLRDLKLRKFVFADQQRTYLTLDGLEDSCTLSDPNNDYLTDKHGCPAYVSPEILSSSGYSGRAADIWSLGVILYTLLFGQYPFHATVAGLLFSKIASGSYRVPDIVSASARCLVKGLLRKEPSERLTIEDVCWHPWLDPARSRTSEQVQPQQARCALPAQAAGAQLMKPNAAAKESEQHVPEWRDQGR